MTNGSPFDHGDNECKYYSPEHFSQTIHPTNNSLSLFCLNCRSISANWDCIHELICNLSSRGFLFDIIGLTEVFKIPDYVIQYNRKRVIIVYNSKQGLIQMMVGVE